MSTKFKACSFKDCNSNTEEHPSLRFYNFPVRSVSLLEKWINACDNKLEKFPRFTFKSRYVCSKHFGNSDYLHAIAEFRGKLKKDVVPKCPDTVGEFNIVSD